MNTLLKIGRTMLNAMAFSNVGNMSEFQAMLQKPDMTAASSVAKTASAGHGRKSAAHGEHLRHANPAL